MKVWKIRIINDFGLNPAWSICFLRLTFASLPPVFFLLLNRYFQFTEDDKIAAIIAMIFFIASYIWRLFTAYTWHDRLSNTKIIDVSKIPAEKNQ